MLIDALLHFVKVCHNEVSTKQVPLPRKVSAAVKLCYLSLLGRIT